MIIEEKWEEPKFSCPVCGNLVEEHEICEVCNWENTGLVNIDGGPNKMTLKEAIEAYENGSLLNKRIK